MRPLQNIFSMNSLMAALMFFTRLPFWRVVSVPSDKFKNVVNWWPFAGILTGASMSLFFYAATFLFPITISVVIALVVRLLMTGALHEDGLADFCDGFGGGTTRERRLEIMKDSHIGSYGVIGLILYYILIIFTLSSLPLEVIPFILFVGDIFSKTVASQIINFLPYVRRVEESKAKVIYNRMPIFNIILNFLFAALLFYFLVPKILWPAAILPCVFFVLLVLFMKVKIGGYTGDCCGAMFLLCELSFYLGASAIVHSCI
jgi:adenosylcobinamide-GDP ribazoletransferase